MGKKYLIYKNFIRLYVVFHEGSFFFFPGSDEQAFAEGQSVHLGFVHEFGFGGWSGCFPGANDAGEVGGLEGILLSHVVFNGDIAATRPLRGDDQRYAYDVSKVQLGGRLPCIIVLQHFIGTCNAHAFACDAGEVDLPGLAFGLDMDVGSPVTGDGEAACFLAGEGECLADGFAIGGDAGSSIGRQFFPAEDDILCRCRGGFEESCTGFPLKSLP